MRNIIPSSVTLILLPSCGILTGPMVVRLSPEQQQQVDTSLEKHPRRTKQ